MAKELEGLIYKSTGSWYIAKDEAGQLWNLRIKGRFKVDKDISSTNPIAVGDRVTFEVEDEATNTGTISAITDRHNYIVRVSPHNRHQKHIVASNLDAAMVMATIREPRTSNGFIDRFLITAEAYHIPAIVVINKIDVLKPKDQDQLAHWQDMYRDAGYEVYAISTLLPETIEILKARLHNITTLFSGHSGVGKSTLINLLIPGKDLVTQEVSGYSGKGQHTTTFAEMFDLPGGGRIIDTPGVKEFGLIDFEKEELAQYFPEMRRVMSGCKFNNCLHVNEPGCAVKDAVNNGVITIDRYASYLTILDTIEKKW